MHGFSVKKGMKLDLSLKACLFIYLKLLETMVTISFATV